MSMITSSQKVLKLTWKIQKYSDCIQRLGEGIFSPQFEIESLGPMSWCLVFYPRGYKNPDYVACFLKHCDGDGYRNRGAIVDLEICLKAENGAENFVQFRHNLWFKNKYFMGFPQFVSFKELRRCPFPNDILTLQCRVSPSNDSTKYVEDFIPLSNDIKLLHDETTFYDVIIRAGKKEFKVHKPLLIARFPSLINKIECSHYEESIPFVAISDFSPAIVREVLHFVYTGKLTRFSRSSYHHTKLKEFASKYGMVNLLSKLKWDIDECIMINHIKITKTNHLLPLRHKVEIVFSVPLLGNHSTAKLKIQYLPLDCLEGININVLISIETSSVYKYSLLAKFKGSIIYENKTVKCCKQSISMNNFDSGNNVRLGSYPSHYFMVVVKKDSLPKNGIECLNCDWKVSFGSSRIKTLPTFWNTLASFSDESGTLTSFSDESGTLTSFSEDMYGLFHHGIGTDLVLVTALDGIEFNVHKSVVCARVPSLMAMFKDDTFAVNGYVHDDLKNVKVSISDVDSDTFRAILQYIYSGQIDETAMNKVLKLYPHMVPIYMKQLQNGRNGNFKFRNQRNNKLVKT